MGIVDYSKRQLQTVSFRTRRALI